MRSCRVVSVLAVAGFVAMSAAQACGGDLPKAQTGPVTTDLPADASLPPRVIDGPPATDPSKIDVRFITGRVQVTAPTCSRVFIAAIKGVVTPPQGMIDDVLKEGDVLIVKYPQTFYVDVEKLALRVIQPFACKINDPPGPETSTRRAQFQRELTWADGKMHAHLDVGKDVSPGLYLGRLEGTMAVPEHKHETSNEIIAASEASGTLTIGGVPQHVTSGQVVVIPMNTLHSWQPDPGTKLVAIQMYAPPGPEERFVGYDADAKDAGVLPPDAGDGGFCHPPYLIDPRNGFHRYRAECLENGQRPAEVPVEAWDPISKEDRRSGDAGAWCNPPYVLNKDGSKRYRPECLRQ